MWSTLYHWFDNSNFGGLILGIAVPGALVAFFHHRAQVRLHLATRRHHEEHANRVIEEVRSARR